MGIMRSVTEAPDDGNELTWPRRTVKKALKNPESPPRGGAGGLQLLKDISVVGPLPSAGAFYNSL